jgi:hypothetical protein
MIIFNFVPKSNPVIDDFRRYEKRILEDLAFHSPGLEWDSKEEIMKTEPMFKDASMELQEQAMYHRVGDILQSGYLSALERVTRQ